MVLNNVIMVSLLLILLGCKAENPAEAAYLSYVSRQEKYITSKYDLKPFGFGGFNRDGIKGYSFTFITHQRVDIESGRKLIVNVMEDILRETNDELIKESKQPLTLDHFSLAILFSDEKNHLLYVSEANLAMIDIVDRMVIYDVKLEEPIGLQQVFKEPYSNAYEKVTGERYIEPMLLLDVKNGDL